MPTRRQPQLPKALRHGEQQRDWFTFRNASDGRVELDIYGEIGGYSWWDDDDTVTASGFRKQLKNHKGKDLTVHINSPGGSVFEGLAIYNALQQHDGDVEVIVDALAASAASFIAMAASPGQLFMARNAIMMIHDASGLAIGNAADMREMADLLDMHSDNIADIYAQRSDEDAAFWRLAMEAETWYTGTEAVNAGLADSVLEDENEKATEAANKFDLSIFNHAGREKAPAPNIVHKRIKAQMDQAKENAVTAPNGEQSTETPPGTEQTEQAGATGDGAPQPGSEPEVQPEEEQEEQEPETGGSATGSPAVSTAPTASARGPVTMLINGVQETDPRRIQAHITALETAALEARNGSRAEFVNQLVTSNRLPATELEATVSFAQELSDAQYESWTRQWNNAASLPLLGRHGGGEVQTNQNGAGSTEPQNESEERVKVLTEIVAQHKRSGKTQSFIENTGSFKELVALNPDFKL